MKGAILEVLVVGAEGIRHTNLLGHPAYYIIGQCGTQVYRSKLSSGKGEEVCWNEKFLFEFSLSDWKKLAHLKLKILDKELFSDCGFVGETIVHLGGIVTEGIDRGFIELLPAFYNVVLEDDTYKGKIKIGFKFIADKEVRTERRLFIREEKEPPKSLCKTLKSLWKISWWRLLFFYNRKNSEDKEKHI